MNWCSIDPANKAGIAFWVDGKLIRTRVIRKMGSKGKWLVGNDVCPSRIGAWYFALNGQNVVVTEEGCGQFTTAVKSQAAIRGYIEAVCDGATDSGFVTRFLTVNVSEWRRVIKEAYGVSWPAKTERKKALSIQLVKEHFGISVTDDEADAVLLGAAALRMGLVDLKGGAK